MSPTQNALETSYSGWHSSTLTLSIKPNSWAQSGCFLRLICLGVAPGDRIPHCSGRSLDKIYSKRTSDLANWEKKSSLICSQRHLGISQATCFLVPFTLRQPRLVEEPCLLSWERLHSSLALLPPDTLSMWTAFLENLTQGRHLVDFVQHGTQFCTLLQWNQS